MNVCLCSSFRNAASYIDRYFEQVEGLAALLALRGDRLALYLGYGDSTDNTGELLHEAASWAVGALLIECSHGGPQYGPVADAQRFRQLAFVANRILACIPYEAERVVWMESDLVWTPATLLCLLDKVDEYPVIAPMVMHAQSPGLYAGAGPFFYDTYAFRRNGVQFTNQPPYHADLRDAAGEMLQLDSAGSCLVMRGELARQITCPQDDVVVGMCRQINELGESIWLHRLATVFHP